MGKTPNDGIMAEKSRFLTEDAVKKRKGLKTLFYELEKLNACLKANDIKGAKEIGQKTVELLQAIQES